MIAEADRDVNATLFLFRYFGVAGSLGAFISELIFTSGIPPGEAEIRLENFYADIRKFFDNINFILLRYRIESSFIQKIYFL